MNTFSAAILTETVLVSGQALLSKNNKNCSKVVDVEFETIRYVKIHPLKALTQPTTLKRLKTCQKP
jgi:hypothetical protein